MPSIDFAWVRSRISIQQVLELMNFQPHRRTGYELRGVCPIHGSTRATSRSFAVNLQKNAFRCFSCGAQGNQLDLWAAVRQQPLYEATVDLCQRLGESVTAASLSNASKPAKPDHRVTGRTAT